MAGIGDDIKDVIDELGTTIAIYKYNGTVYNEKADFTNYPTNSSEFIRNFFSSLDLVYDTQLVSGDIIGLGGAYFLATYIFPEIFEDSLVDNQAALYRCNVYGSLKRLTIVRNPSTLIDEHTWGVIKSPIRALQYEEKTGNDLALEQNVQGLIIDKHALFLPIWVSAQIDDRWYPNYSSTSEYYRISDIENRRLDNISICTLEEDSRT